MESEITYFVSYPCPRCKTELEAQHGGWRGWLRCPVCGMPSLPPEFLLGHPSTRRRVQDSLEGTGTGAIGTEDAADSSMAMDRIPLARSSPTSPLRLIFLTGLVLSLFLLLLAYVDQNKQTTAIFGFLSIAFFLLLLRTPSNRAARQE